MNSAYHMTSVSRPMRLRVCILVRILVVRTGSQIINIPIKGFTAKKSVVLNDDEPRPVPIPKDFVHLTIRKIDEAHIEFISV